MVKKQAAPSAPKKGRQVSEGRLTPAEERRVGAAIQIGEEQAAEPHDLTLGPKPEPKADRRGFHAADGPATGYRDGPKGTIEAARFADGWIPKGWLPTYANLKNRQNKTENHIKVNPKG